MSNPKRHHIVPNFYLKQWRDPANTQRSVVWSLDKETLKPLKGSPHQPHNILVEGHYFTEHETDGTRHAPTEKYLSYNEASIASLLPCLEAGQSLSEANRNALWSFVLAMFTRTTWWRRPLQENLMNRVRSQVPQKVKARAIKQEEESFLGRYNRADRRKILHSRRQEIDALVESQSGPLLEQLIDSLKTKIHPLLVRAALDLEEARTYPFTLIEVKELPLVTSDTPCIIEEDLSILQLNRENVKGGAFVCPLTPKLAFVGALGLRDNYATFDSKWSQLLNTRIRANAEKLLIANTSAVDNTWFLTAPDLPLTMREIIQSALESLRRESSAAQAKGFSH